MMSNWDLFFKYGSLECGSNVLGCVSWGHRCEESRYMRSSKCVCFECWPLLLVHHRASSVTGVTLWVTYVDTCIHTV